MKYRSIFSDAMNLTWKNSCAAAYKMFIHDRQSWSQIADHFGTTIEKAKKMIFEGGSVSSRHFIP